MKVCQEILTGYSRWMREVPVSQSTLLSLLHLIGNSRVIQTKQFSLDHGRGIIKRPFGRYQTEIPTIYGQLRNLLGVPVKPAPDEWDRRHNIDFFIEVKEKYIGVQIIPKSHSYTTQIINELEFQKKTHEKFTAKYGGKVFYIISLEEDKKKIIHNREVIGEIKKEIERLSRE